MTKLRGNPWAALTVTCLGFFMTMLDLTIVNIAIPDMMGRLKASFDDVLWVLNGYTLVLAVLLITAGRLGDLRGARKMFVLGVAVFTVASGACGFAAGPGQLIAFRVAQGLGAALLMPQTLTIITTAFPARRRGAALGIWGAVGAAATMLGPSLGGLLVTVFDWRGIFLLNVPIGIVVVALALWLLPDVAPSGRRRLDLRGVLLASASLLALSYGLVEGERYHWGTISGILSIPLILVVGAVLLGVFVLTQSRAQAGEPLVPFVLFRDRNYMLMNVVTAALPISLTGFFLPLAIYLQAVLGLSALAAGLAMATMTVVMLVLAPLAGRFGDRVDGKYPLTVGLVLFAIGTGWIAASAETTSGWTDFLAPLIIGGAGLGLLFAPVGALAMRDVEPRLAGAASGVLNTTRQIGMVVGTAIVGALMQNRFAASINAEAATRGQVLPEPARTGFVQGFRHVAESGLQVGASSGGDAPPPGIPAEVAQLLAKLGREVFTNGYMGAMRPTLVLSLSVALLAALISLAIKRTRPAGGVRAELPEVPEEQIPAEAGSLR
ncbi:DHA2 family efflux MFS transporter permease subunit [Amycolatopsis sp. H20-H5]|uniref:DHA2 family efflux MFS transporter permease subunit n=1 Tax=Amycolatopsis sp. H20-H5 TaxID=3046309 RepID=UPI002DB923C8|nr:DHA2 family efflux MFS transporter permease subunit [Amycolatopsis sp. H20-H5]MEC3976899.1 DHA2 family efflux MFS transporter permease subunit [Amycolatopsis sp. H20-H5]